MAECQIAEFFLNGLSPHVTFDDLQKKKMPSTPSKTNCQANYFGSKVLPTESNYNSEKKAPIWQKKSRLFARYAKSPLFLHIFEHSASVSVFGLRPDVFPARYSVSA